MVPASFQAFHPFDLCQLPQLVVCVTSQILWLLAPDVLVYPKFSGCNQDIGRLKNKSFFIKSFKWGETRESNVYHRNHMCRLHSEPVGPRNSTDFL